jgi:hypothetical protein
MLAGSRGGELMAVMDRDVKPKGKMKKMFGKENGRAMGRPIGSPAELLGGQTN